MLSLEARLTLVGTGLGLAGRLALAQTMKAVLFRVSATDRLTLFVSVASLAAVALLASYVPARRATRVESLTALKSE